MMSSRFLVALLLVSGPLLTVTWASGEDDVGDEKEFINELEEHIDTSPVEELVDLICRCQIEEACGKSESPGEIDPIKPKASPRDCYDIFQLGQEQSGQYDIHPIGFDGRVRVYCDMTNDGGGWTVFQRREDATVDFYLEWEDYKAGFGQIGGNFWLGNENLFLITNQEKYELRIDLEDFDGGKRYAKYDHFRVGAESSNYMLAIGAYTGDAGDAMTERHANSAFSTKDRDNDGSTTSDCAKRFQGGWWYSNCYFANLNGVYLQGKDSGETSVIWHKWRPNYSLKHVEMKMRPFAANIVE